MPTVEIKPLEDPLLSLPDIQRAIEAHVRYMVAQRESGRLSTLAQHVLINQGLSSSDAAQRLAVTQENAYMQSLIERQGT